MIIRDFFDPGKPVGLVDCAVYAGLGIAQVVVSSEGSQLINALTPIACTLVFSKIICQLSDAISPNSLTSSGKRVYSLLLAGCVVFKTVELFGSISLSSLVIVATLAAFHSQISVKPAHDELERVEKENEKLEKAIEMESFKKELRTEQLKTLEIANKCAKDTKENLELLKSHIENGKLEAKKDELRDESLRKLEAQIKEIEDMVQQAKSNEKVTALESKVESLSHKILMLESKVTMLSADLVLLQAKEFIKPLQNLQNTSEAIAPSAQEEATKEAGESSSSEIKKAEVLATQYDYDGISHERIARYITDSFQSKTDLDVILEGKVGQPIVRVVCNVTGEKDSCLLFSQKKESKKDAGDTSSSTNQSTIYTLSSEASPNSRMCEPSYYTHRCIVMAEARISTPAVKELRKILAKHNIDVYIEEQNLQTSFYQVSRLPSHRFSPPSESSSSTKLKAEDLRDLRIKKFGPKSSSKEKEEAPTPETQTSADPSTPPLSEIPQEGKSLENSFFIEE